MNMETIAFRVAGAIAKARGCDPIKGLPAGIMAEARAAVRECFAAAAEEAKHAVGKQEGRVA